MQPPSAGLHPGPLPGCTRARSKVAGTARATTGSPVVRRQRLPLWAGGDVTVSLWHVAQFPAPLQAGGNIRVTHPVLGDGASPGRLVRRLRFTLPHPAGGDPAPSRN
ncbi:hypothetical protein Sm713_16600 [Streptomyces sp. TS71-3]|nr:hypothetical protein Sm713_16600 [Streptomyces sp. TS71-3]